MIGPRVPPPPPGQPTPYTQNLADWATWPHMATFQHTSGPLKIPGIIAESHQAAIGQVSNVAL